MHVASTMEGAEATGLVRLAESAVICRWWMCL